MGVGIAFKTSSFNVLDVDISRLADKREGGWPRSPPKPEHNVVKRSVLNVAGFAATTTKNFLGLFGLYDVNKRPPQDAWSMAQNRFNQLVTVKLQDKVTQKSFAIGNYHMPCAFYKPEVMTIHTDLAARHVQKLASTPKIFCYWKLSYALCVLQTGGHDYSYRSSSTSCPEIGKHTKMYRRGQQETKSYNALRLGRWLEYQTGWIVISPSNDWKNG